MTEREIINEGLCLSYPGVAGNGEVYLDVMKAICGDTSDKSMLDLMCYRAPYTSQLGFQDRTYVDILDRGLDNKDEQKYFVKSDAVAFLIDAKRLWDIAICSDGIEHLFKSRGNTLAYLMQDVSHKQIIFTPTRDKNIVNNGDPDSHKSSWTPDDFEAYAIIDFPDFHPILDQGAFFAFKCGKIIDEFERVKNELKNKSWSK